MCSSEFRSSKNKRKNEIETKAKRFRISTFFNFYSHIHMKWVLLIGFNAESNVRYVIQFHSVIYILNWISAKQIEKYYSFAFISFLLLHFLIYCIRFCEAPYFHFSFFGLLISCSFTKAPYLVGNAFTFQAFLYVPRTKD